MKLAVDRVHVSCIETSLWDNLDK